VSDPWPRLAFVDLETTGATATADRITEVGIVAVDETGVHEWSSLVNPGTRISEFIERLTGISNAMVATAPRFEDLAAEIAARLEGRLFIAHNARFDYGFLKNEFCRTGLRFQAPLLCTVKLSRRLPAILDELPEVPGVYLFYGENDLPLYVGKSKDIRQRVLSHFAGDHTSAKEMALSQQLRRIEWRETAGEIGALLLEAALVKELRPVHNRRLRANEAVCSWHLAETAPGLWQPRLVTAEEADLGRDQDLFGLFKDAREARRVLEQLAGEHGLCHALLGLEKVRPGRPCFAHQIHKCRGACVGKELPSMHSGRLMAALAKIRLKPWPFPGAAVLREGDAVHLIDGWRYRGTARSDEELAALLDTREAGFDADVYKVLAKVAGRLQALP